MAQLLIDRPELTLAPEGLGHDDEIRLHRAIGQMTNALARAIVEQQSSASPLPATHPAIDGCFATLSPLDGFFQELTYIATADAARPELNVEGVFVEPVALAACMDAVPEDDASDKLLDLFHGSRLLSLTIRREVTRPDLARFLEMAASGLAAAAGDPAATAPPAARLGEHLAAAGVITISVLDREDVIPAKTGMSWRVRLALSRLGKSLHDLPLYQRVTGRDPQQVRVTLLREITSTLRPDQLLTEFMHNADLARTAGTDLERADVQGDVVTVLLTPQVRAVTGYLVRLLAAPDAANVDFAWRARHLALLRRCFPRMADLLDEDMVAILRAAVEHKLVTPEEMPAHLRDALDTEKLTTAFLANPTLSLARLRATRDLESWRQFGSSFAGIVSELMRCRRYAEANQVTLALAELASPTSAAGPRVKQLAGKATIASATLPNLERMALHLPKLPSEDRGQLLALLGRFGATAVPLLIRRLHDNRDDELRVGLRTLLASLGKTALPLVTHGLRRQPQRPETCRSLLLVLAAMRDATAYDLAAGLLHAEHPRVREAALVAVARIDGGRAEPELAKALADPFVSVQASAVEELGALGSSDSAFLLFLLDLFEGKMQARVSTAAQKGTARQFSLELSEHYRLLLAGCAAVVNLARRGGMDLAEFEPPLMRSLKRSDGPLLGLAQRVLAKGPELDQSEEQRIASAMALVTALAWIGTAQCLPVLREIGKRAVPRVAGLAERAIEEITARIA